MTKKFDPSRPVQTRDGRVAHIIATDLNGDNGDTIIAVIRDKNGEAETVETYQPSGAYVEGFEQSLDLLNVSPAFAADRIEDEVAYVSLGDSYSGIPARRSIGGEAYDAYPIVRLTIKGGRVDSAEFVTVDEMAA